MEDNKGSIKEYTQANVGSFIKPTMTQLQSMPSFQKLHAVEENGKKVIVFTYDDKWYKFPYTMELYNCLIGINADNSESLSL